MVISPTTGAINLVTSAAGTYIVTYTFSNIACTRTTTTSVTISTCSITATRQATEPYTLSKGAKPQLEIEITAYPNPTQNHFNVKVSSTVKETVEVRMFDMLGKMIEIKRGAPDQVLRFGEGSAAGMYIIEARQAGQKEKAMIKVVKKN